MSAATDQNKARELFVVALRIPPAQREAYLAEACAGDEALRRRVADLLAAHERAGSFLASPAAGLADAAADLGPGATVDQPELPPPERPGTQVGPYKLLERIGEGGMGSVFLAEQTRPVRRQVALKVIKAGMDTRQVVARFEAERQALALMDHPNIAKVLDAGVTESGRPYFVMELVKGVPITRYCDEHRLTPRDRLALFVQVCSAVQHAHQKGVIHRDLKPSNVLVAQYDGRPVPKVIDFGVAKATGGRLTEATLFTGFGAVVGTPEYMSPEQAELNQLDVDTRSDVYSLGVILYELLTGTTPLDRSRFKEAALLEMLRVVREEEPPRPSTRLSTTDKLPSIAANRGLEPKKLSGLVRGELDWIVMKALEKDRTRRYETATGLARDVERYLRDDAVEACAPSAVYRLRKFARRNRIALATLSLVVFSLVLVGGGLGWIVRDRSIRRATLADLVGRGLSDSEALYRNGKLPEAIATAEKAQGLLLVGGGDTELEIRSSRWLADLNMVARLEEWRSDISPDSLERFEGYAKAFREYGIDVEKLPPAEAAGLIAARPIRIDLTIALDHMLAGRDAKLDPSRQRPVLDIARAADPDPWRDRLRNLFGRSDAAAREELLQVAGKADGAALSPASWLLLVVALHHAGVRDAAETANRKALSLHPGDFRLNFEPVRQWIAQDIYADPIRARDPARVAEAVEFSRAAVAIRPRNDGARHALACALKFQGKLDEAAAVIKQAIRLKPEDWSMHNTLGMILFDKDMPDEAVAALRDAIRLKPDEPGPYSNLSLTLMKQGKADEAVAAAREAVRLVPGNGGSYINLASALAAQGKTEEAVAAYREAVRLNPADANPRFRLGQQLHHAREWEEAAAAYREAIRLKPDFHEAHGMLGMALRELRRLDEAVAACREAIRLKPDHPWHHNYLGAVLFDQRKWGEAAAEFREAVRLDPNDLGAHSNLAVALRAHGKEDEARAADVARLAAETRAAHKAIARQPRNANEYHDRAHVLARAGRFREALPDFAKAIELDPTDHGKYTSAAVASLYAGETEGYRRICQEMVQRFEATKDPAIAERTAKVCSLAVSAVADFGRVEELAERAVQGTDQHPYYRFFLLAKGLTLYRAGRPAQAVEWLERFAPSTDGVHWDATALAALAMARHRLDRSDEARANLAEAKAILAQKMPDPSKGAPFDGGNWHDWLHAQILTREAEALLGETRPAR